MARRDKDPVHLRADQFRALWAANWPPGKLAGLAGVDKQAIYARAKRLALPERNREAVQARHYEITRAQAHLSVLATADLRAAGVDVRPKSKAIPPDSDLKVLWDANLPIRTICIALEQNHQWIYARARVNGWAPRDMADVEAKARQIRIERQDPFDLADSLLEAQRAKVARVAVKVVAMRRAPGKPPGQKIRPSAPPAHPPTPVFRAPGWDDATDSAIRATGGAYAEIRKLAARLAIPSGRVLARFHHLRVMR